MAFLDKLMSKLKSDPDFTGLADEQNQAVVDALMEYERQEQRAAFGTID